MVALEVPLRHPVSSPDSDSGYGKPVLLVAAPDITWGLIRPSCGSSVRQRSVVHTDISRRNQSIRLIWLTSSSPLGLHPPYQQTGITNTSREASASMLALLREQICMAHLLGTFSSISPRRTSIDHSQILFVDGSLPDSCIIYLATATWKLVQ